MYIFGIVVATRDKGPVGRASAALKDQLPSRFPGYRFEFFDSSHVILEMAEALLFRVLGGGLSGMNDEIIRKVPSNNLVLTIQAAVDEIVVKAKAMSLN